MEAPEHVVVGQPFALTVSLSEDLLSAATTATQGNRLRNGQLALPLPDGQDEWMIDVILSAPDFELVDGRNTGRLRLPRVGDSDPARFELIPRAVASARAEVKVHATLWHAGSYLGKMSRPLRIESAGTAVSAAVPDAPTRRSGLGTATRVHVDTALRAPDLTILIHTTSTNDGALTGDLTVVSPHLQPIASNYKYRRAAGLNQVLSGGYQQLALTRGPTPVGLPTRNSKERQASIDLLTGLGRQLWDAFAPDPVKRAFWQLTDVMGERPLSIQVITNDPELPWELMRPLERSSGREVDFLGISTRFARWHFSDADRQLVRPPQQTPMAGLVAIAPRYTGARELAAVTKELTALSAVPGFRTVPGQFATVRQLFAAPPDGVLHFSGHGRLRTSAAGPPEYAIELENNEHLGLLQWRGFVDPGGMARTLVFFNACELGQAETVAGYVNGWAPAVLDAGAAGFIGGLWPISDQGAAAFATKFYGELQSRLQDSASVRVADLLAVARRTFYDTGDPTYLAYVYYGDPEFRLRRVP